MCVVCRAEAPSLALLFKVGYHTTSGGPELRKGEEESCSLKTLMTSFFILSSKVLLRDPEEGSMLKNWSSELKTKKDCIWIMSVRLFPFFVLMSVCRPARIGVRFPSVPHTVGSTAFPITPPKHIRIYGGKIWSKRKFTERAGRHQFIVCLRPIRTGGQPLMDLLH